MVKFCTLLYTTTVLALVLSPQSHADNSLRKVRPPACAREPTKYEALVGLGLVADAACVGNAVGCISQSCRYCQVDLTEESKLYSPCMASACSIRPTPQDIVSGIDILVDLSCSSGGIGCMGHSCRLCTRTESDKSSGYLSCDSISASSDDLVDPDMTDLDVTGPGKVKVKSDFSMNGSNQNANEEMSSLSVVTKDRNKPNEQSNGAEGILFVGASAAGVVAAVAFVSRRVLKRPREQAELVTPTVINHRRPSIVDNSYQNAGTKV